MEIEDDRISDDYPTYTLVLNRGDVKYFARNRKGTLRTNPHTTNGDFYLNMNEEGNDFFMLDKKGEIYRGVITFGDLEKIINKPRKLPVVQSVEGQPITVAYVILEVDTTTLDETFETIPLDML